MRAPKKISHLNSRNLEYYSTWQRGSKVADGIMVGDQLAFSKDIILDYLGDFSVITKVLKTERGRQKRSS